MTKKKIANKERKKAGPCTDPDSYRAVLAWSCELPAHTLLQPLNAIMVLEQPPAEVAICRVPRSSPGSEQPELSAFSRLSQTVSSTGTSQGDQSRGNQVGNSLAAHI